MFNIKEIYNIKGMTCAACQANITKAVSKVNGVKSVNVNLLSNSMAVEFDENTTSSEDIIVAVVSIGYSAEVVNKTEKSNSFSNEWDKRKQLTKENVSTLKNRLFYSIILLIPLMYFSMGKMMSLPFPQYINNTLSLAIMQLLFAFPVLFINKKFFITGMKGLIKGVPNMDTLVMLGSSASFLYSVFSLLSVAFAAVNGKSTTGYHFYFDSSAMILTLVTVGKYLESVSKSKTTNALDRLLDLAPKTAVIIKNGQEVRVTTDSIELGDIVVIKPGDIIPVDGIVIEGRGFVDQSAISGESLPIEINIGDSVMTASVNKNGAFKFRAEKIGEDTTLSQIIKLVDDASNSKAPIARIADKVSAVFVPIVIAISVLTAIIWLILGKEISFALTSAVSVLVISCPCALGLATPVAIMVGTGKAANMGILVKDAGSLEKLHSIDTVILDKTGTITEGEPSLSDICVVTEKYDKKEILKLAASLEKNSNHPYALAVTKAYNDNDFLSVFDFTDNTGKGVFGTINGSVFRCGNQKFLTESGLKIPSNIVSVSDKYHNEGKTTLFLAENDEICALLSITDAVRPSSYEAIKMLKSMKINTVLLSGDNKIVANAVGKAVGIDEVYAEVLPNQKSDYVKAAVNSGRNVAMIGDGINDAPALANATVGIAIGAGTDIAVETADIVLVKNSLFDAVNAIKLSAAIIKNIKMNLFWAFFYNCIGIPIAAGAFYDFFKLQLSPMFAAAAMSLSSVFVVCNALRLRKFKEIKFVNENKGDTAMKKTILIDGMMCMHCKANVEKILLSIDGVSDVVVSLENKTAEVTLTKNIENNVFVSAIETAGYKIISCK